MHNFLRSLILSMLGLGVASKFVDGFVIESVITLLVAAFILNIVNAFIKPILTFLTLPFTILTFGLFLLVINALTLSITSFLVPGFAITSFSAAFWGWVAVSVSGVIGGIFIEKK